MTSSSPVEYSTDSKISRDFASWAKAAVRAFGRISGKSQQSTAQTKSNQTENKMNVATEIKTADNGVNVEALLGAREAITGAPEAGQFKWRAQTDWVEGVHSRSTVGGFFGLGEEQERNATFHVDADHPEQFAAGNVGMSPVELVLSGLGSCLTAGVAAVAQNRGIQLKKVSAVIEGDMDLAGILGIDSDVRNGFSGINVTFEIEADATAEEIAAVVAQSQKRSAVFDIITNPGTVNVKVA